MKTMPSFLRVDGWVILDKPLGMTSTAAVTRVRKLFGASKAGHGGTLDPLATGLLAIALGEATKTVSIVMDAPKTYRFTARWGAETATDDLEGAISIQSGLNPSAAEITAVLPAFTGVIEQIPPIYSAVKIAGERAYSRARNGEDVSLSARQVEVYELAVEAFRPDEADFLVRCGKGTYVRALARDIGRRLGCLAHVTSLRRLSTGPFNDTHMFPLEKLEDLSHNGGGRKAVLTALYPLWTALDDIPALALSEMEAGRLRQGQSVVLRTAGVLPEQDTVLVLSGGKPLALAAVTDGVIRPKRVFNL